MARESVREREAESACVGFEIEMERERDGERGEKKKKKTKRPANGEEHLALHGLLFAVSHFEVRVSGLWFMV